MARRSSSSFLAAACLALAALLSLKTTRGVFVPPLRASEGSHAAAAVAAGGTIAMLGASPVLAVQNLEGTLEDNSSIFAGLAVVATIISLALPGAFAMLSTNTGKFQGDQAAIRREVSPARRKAGKNTKLTDRSGPAGDFSSLGKGASDKVAAEEPTA
eukprot:TRINITY_DN67164_c0_g1_i1.p1 TRINITY_DN67164_c0_g1~~TRINITY_DN67164_c0_g1_i1.p1  ORF type:complete len:158 (-),score=36.70 TRINITY_DN67164_c0_g1_i1:78-551(-)